MRLLLLIVKIITAICLVALPATVLIRTWKFRVCRTKKEHHIIRAILVAWTVTGLLAAILVCGVPLNSFLRHKKLCALSTENEELTLLNSNLEAELIHKGNKHDQLIKGGKIYLYDGTSINIRRNSG
ncbi:MAG: hypothetical protein KAH23_10285, partial [Kiritimatiellae bacterium]|nr:hypothetical protein [Kiritimatiellia bacterium]